MQQQSLHWEVRFSSLKTVHEKKKSYLRLDSFDENITVSGLIKSKESWMKMYHQKTKLTSKFFLLITFEHSAHTTDISGQ